MSVCGVSCCPGVGHGQEGGVPPAQGVLFFTLSKCLVNVHCKDDYSEQIYLSRKHKRGSSHLVVCFVVCFALFLQGLIV